MALNIARRMGWRCYREVISSRTQASHLLWHVDVVKRFQDAQLGRSDLDIRRYVRPGVLWKAIAPESAGEPPPYDRRAVVLHQGL